MKLLCFGELCTVHNAKGLLSAEVPEWVWRNRKLWRISRLPVSGGWSLEALQNLGTSSAPQLTVGGKKFQWIKACSIALVLCIEKREVSWWKWSDARVESSQVDQISLQLKRPKQSEFSSCRKKASAHHTLFRHRKLPGKRQSDFLVSQGQVIQKDTFLNSLKKTITCAVLK